MWSKSRKSGKLVTAALVTASMFAEVFGLIEHVYFRHFEPALYDHVTLQNTHHVTKRTTGEVLHFRFKAYGRTFLAKLTRDASIFHRDMMIETSNRTVPYDVSSTYIGRLEGEPSHVHGIITASGHFEGKIYTDRETFFIEKAERHFSDTPVFHSVIFKLSDMTFNHSMASCMLDRLHKRQIEMSRIANNILLMGREEINSQKKLYHRYTDEMFDDSGTKNASSGDIQRISERKPRAVDPAKVSCELYMQADHLYYQLYDSDVDTVIEKLAQHVQAVNTIYRAVDFDKSGAPDNIGFVIKKIKVYTDPDAVGYKYGGQMDADSFLDEHSQDDYDDFCLSYLFTHRDFPDGVLGLAWLGDATTISGGVCEKHALYEGVGMSLNTGVVTTLNHGSEIPSAVAQVVFAHEIGHNFGALHDDDDNHICSPGGEGGNYLMYAHATSGTLPNNHKLSSCSIASMRPVLDAKARSDSGCFVAYTDALCGNGVVEGGEECDCGWEGECIEGCCNPQVFNVTGAPTACTMKDTSVCSPSQGPCCDASCQLVGVSTPCRPASYCLQQAFCTGSSGECPASEHINDTTPCGDANNYLVCFEGECTGSVCLAHGREPCQCSGSSPDSWQDEILCHVCCQDGGQCRSSFELDGVPDATLVSGSPCNNYGGYCDVNKKCEKVDASEPLDSQKFLSEAEETLDKIKDWLTEHWYVGAAAGGVLVLICIIVLVWKICFKSQPKRVAPSSRQGPSNKTLAHQQNSYHAPPERWI